jgi:hypothetical protein
MWWKAPKMPRLRSEKYDSEKLTWTMPRTYSPRVWFHRLVRGELLVQAPVAVALVGHDVGLALDLVADDALQGGALEVVHLPGARLALARHQREHRDLAAARHRAARRAGPLAANERLVGLDDAADLAAVGRRVLLHRLPAAVAHEPRGLVLDLQGAVELVRRDALLRGRPAGRPCPHRRRPSCRGCPEFTPPHGPPLGRWPSRKSSSASPRAASQRSAPVGPRGPRGRAPRIDSLAGGAVTWLPCRRSPW